MMEPLPRWEVAKVGVQDEVKAKQQVDILAESIKGLAEGAAKTLVALGNASLARGKAELGARFLRLALQVKQAAEEL